MDYRKFIKHLYKTFHVRIEMRHIGMREEANRIGDIGVLAEIMCAVVPGLLILKLIPLL